jgi:hypothetical protein
MAHTCIYENIMLFDVYDSIDILVRETDDYHHNRIEQV